VRIVLTQGLYPRVLTNLNIPDIPGLFLPKVTNSHLSDLPENSLNQGSQRL